MAKAKQPVNEETNFKLIAFTCDGIRKLKAVEMQFDKTQGLIPIVGKNRAGKTTIIDSIEILIRGNKYLEKDIISHGKDKAKIVGTISNGERTYEITRSITRKSSSLKIKDVTLGLDKTDNPQEFLDGFLNAITANPRPFLEKKPEDKLKFLMQLLGIDFTDLDNQIKELYDSRTLVGKERDKVDIAPVEEAKRISVDALLDKQKEIERYNSQLAQVHKANLDVEAEKEKQINDYKRRIAADNDEVTTIDADIHQIDLDIKRLQERKRQKLDRKETLGKDITELTNRLAKAPKPQTVADPEYKSDADIVKQISEASKLNAKAIQYENYLERVKERQAKEKEYSGLTEQIEALRKQKIEILTKADTKVPGLKITEEGVYYNDIFCENWSDAESIKISAQLCIAQLPKLRAVFIDRFESFDQDMQQELMKWAEENSIQAFVFKVAEEIPDTLETGVYYLEEGQIKTAEGAE